MDVSRPYAAITGGGLEGEALQVLTGTTKPLTGRQVARMARHGSERGIRLALNRLAAQGILDVMDAPPALLYSLNRDHIAAPVAISLAGLRGELHRRLRDLVNEWDDIPEHLSVFGSAARGDGDTGSDIDVFVVRPAHVDAEDERWRASVTTLAERVRRWTGNHAGISEVGEQELARLEEEQPDVLRELQRDAITLIGPNPRTLLASTRPLR